MHSPKYIIAWLKWPMKFSDLTIHVLRNSSNKVSQAKRSIGGERRAEQWMQKMSNHAQVDNANDEISGSAISKRKMDDLRIKT